MPFSKPFWLALAPLAFLLLWSGGFSAAKFGLNHAEPMSFLALRYASVLVILLPLWAIFRPTPPARAAEWGHLLLVGFLIQGVYFGLAYVAFSWGVSTGGLAIIVCLQPILVGLVAPHFAGERVGPARWAGLVLGLAGAAIVIAARSTIAAENIFGLALAGLALFGITAGTLWEKRFGTSRHPIVASSVQYAAGLAATLPLALAFETMRFDWRNLEFLASWAYLVIGNSIIAMSLLLAMIRAGEVSRVSSLFYLVPPLSAVIAWPLLGEAMPPLGWLGFALAAAGVAIASRRQRAAK